MFIIKNKSIFIIISALLVGASVVAIFVYGLNFGIDFKGGSIMEVEYKETRPAIEDIKAQLGKSALGEFQVQPLGERGVALRGRDLPESERINLLNTLSFDGKNKLEQKKYTSIGPVLGKELQHKAWIAVALVIVLIVLYIAFAFRKVSRPVSSWKYGLIAVVALLHDVVIPTGFFAILGHFYGVQVDILFISAILAILGFSVHDTIVVFDRIRENLRLAPSSATSKEGFASTVGTSLSQTFVRSINTSLTVLLILLAVLFLGGETTHNFALALVIGIFFGTYSSIFLASPLLVVVNNLKKK